MAENKDTKGNVNIGKFSDTTLRPLLWVVLLSIILLKFPESIILLLVGMLPTMVAFIIDKSVGKCATICVGTMNIAGIFPSIFKLWAEQNSFAQAIHIITNVILMYNSISYIFNCKKWVIYESGVFHIKYFFHFFIIKRY